MGGAAKVKPLACREDIGHLKTSNHAAKDLVCSSISITQSHTNTDPPDPKLLKTFVDRESTQSHESFRQDSSLESEPCKAY